MSILSLGLFSLLWSTLTNLWWVAITPFIVNGWLVGFTERGVRSVLTRKLKHQEKLKLRAELKQKNKVASEASSDVEDTSTKIEEEASDLSEKFQHFANDVKHSNDASPGKHSGLKGLKNWFVMGLHNWFGSIAWTLPGLGMLWAGWYAGWNISFHKVYEYSSIGFLTTLVGWIWLIATIPIVLVGMGRYAISKDWKVFFQARRNWRWIRRAGTRNIFLALVFVITSLPIGVNYFLFYFLGSGLELTEETPLFKIKGILFLYYFLTTLLMLMPVWVITRFYIGYFYFGPTVFRWLRLHRVAPNELTQKEINYFQQLGMPVEECLKNFKDKDNLGFWAKGITPKYRLLTVSATCILWAIFALLINLAQFGRYSGFEGWFNHPMLHNPHYYYAPNLNPGGHDFRMMETNPAYSDDSFLDLIEEDIE